MTEDMVEKNFRIKNSTNKWWWWCVLVTLGQRYGLW